MRVKVALRNLYISQTIILVFLIFAYFAWFPHSFSKLGGFYDTAWMLIFVDLILGPLLVFIIYKEGKKHLNFDVNTLLAIQLFAFIFGAHSLYLKHPTYAVFSKDRFILINSSQATPEKLQVVTLKPSLLSPTFVYVKMPDQINQRLDFMLSISLSNAPPIEERSDFYEPLETYKNEVLNNGIKIEQLLANGHARQSLINFIKLHGGSPNDYAYFPLTGNNKKEIIWVFTRKNMKPIGIIDLDPSKILKVQV